MFSLGTDCTCGQVSSVLAKTTTFNACTCPLRDSSLLAAPLAKMPIFSKFKNRILKRDSDVLSAPVPADKDPNSALPHATATSTADNLSGEGNELWAQAYSLAKEREKQLMEDYERHIASLEGGSVDGKSFSAPHDVQVHVNQLLEIRQRKEIQVSIMGRDITMRKQIEKLAKFLLWSDAIVKSAVSAQPYAALAWSGVSLFLPVNKQSLAKDHGALYLQFLASCMQCEV